MLAQSAPSSSHSFLGSAPHLYPLQRSAMAAVFPKPGYFFSNHIQEELGKRKLREGEGTETTFGLDKEKLLQRRNAGYFTGGLMPHSF